jgi:hypothetical protein
MSCCALIGLSLRAHEQALSQSRSNSGRYFTEYISLTGSITDLDYLRFDSEA